MGLNFTRLPLLGLKAARGLAADAAAARRWSKVAALRPRPTTFILSNTRQCDAEGHVELLATLLLSVSCGSEL